jgi:hypothetical protein
MARTPRPGRCCRPRSWAAARPPPAGGAWMSGPRRACSTSSKRWCWTNWGRPAGSTWNTSGWTPAACERSTEGPDRRPPGRSRQGRVKLHLAGDAGRAAISVVLSAANTGDAAMFEAVVDDSPAIRTPTGRRRRRPAKVQADKAYDHRRCRADLRRRGLRSRLAAAGSSRRTGLAGIAGGSSAPGPGLVAGGGCGSAMRETPNASMPWCC